MAMKKEDAKILLYMSGFAMSFAWTLARLAKKYNIPDEEIDKELDTAIKFICEVLKLG